MRKGGKSIPLQLTEVSTTEKNERSNFPAEFWICLDLLGSDDLSSWESCYTPSLLGNQTETISYLVNS